MMRIMTDVDKEFSEKQILAIQKSIMRRFQRESLSVAVIYNPDCGCPIDHFVLLDRFPMSTKIISSCSECKKGCLMEISEPIIFHDQLTETDFSLEDLDEMIITDSWQYPFLLEYKHLFELGKRKNA